MPTATLQSLLLTRSERYRLVAKARCFFAGLILLYGMGAGFGYLLSDYGLFMTVGQIAGAGVVLCVLTVYNALYFVRAESLASWEFADELQVLLDLAVLSLLVHYSGGAGSWLWPIYMVIALEAAILIENPRQVWGLGLFGGLFYGVVLGGEALDVFDNVEMPFVDASLHHEIFYLVLKWLWVSLLCAAAAVIGTYLMQAVRQAYLRLQSSESRLKGFLDAANDLIFSVDQDGRFLYANHIWSKTLGFSRTDLQSLHMTDIIAPDLRTKCMTEIDKAMQGETIDILESRLVSKDGETVEVEGSVTCSLEPGQRKVLWVICRDVTVRKKAQEQLFFLAHHDLLTGLPNRLSFTESLKRRQEQARRTRNGYAVLYLDLDRFKIVNDTLGHAAGDELLQEVGRRLRCCIRSVDTVGRLGGDEFAIVLADLKLAQDAVQVAAKILKALASPVTLQGQEVFMTTSIGISLFPEHGENGLLLVKKADAAMYQAKAHGRNNFQIYDPQMDAQEERRILLEGGLRQALERGEFQLLYQPKVNVETGAVTALEALIRWQHPELGTLAPNDFIALAEENGMILPIGLWVVRQACSDNARWQKQGLPKVRVAVNLSGYQLQSKRLFEDIEQILKETGMSGDCIEFEIPETVIMQNPKLAAEILGRFQRLGIQISIDDFGTGYSSLAHLQSFAINTLKIDRAFVREIETSPTDAAITSAIISMGNSLNLKVIAEGVETDGQLQILKEKHCDEMQGYLFSKPVPEQDVAALLRRGPCLAVCLLNGKASTGS